MTNTRRCAAGLLAASSLLLGACTPAQPTNPPPTAPAQESPDDATTAVSVAIRNYSFSEHRITVAPGTTVTWTNEDDLPHTVTGDNGGPASGTLTTGQSYSYTFDTPGTFTYHCTIHPAMMAVVTVAP